MRNPKPRWYVILPLIFIFALGFTYSLYRILNSQKESKPDFQDSKYDLEEVYEAFIEEEEYAESELTKLEEVDLELSGWIAYWDFYGALETYKANKDEITSLSPTWYYVLTDGSLGTKNTARNEELIQLCKTNSTKLIPTISNSSAEELSTILNDTKLLYSHIDSIAAEVESYNYDGIDIDYEYIKASDRDQFSRFIQLLAENLHQKEKVLTIAILWKNDLEPLIEAASESRKAQDWKEISKHVDEFRIMAYDYTGSGDSAGPIAPKDWIRSILEYAQENVSEHDKVVLGLPLYAYEWTKGQEGAKALVWSDVHSLAQTNPGLISLNVIDTNSLEKKLEYTSGSAAKVIWYQDAEVSQKRIDLAKTYGIHKFIFWRMGNEDPETFKVQ